MHRRGFLAGGLTLAAAPVWGQGEALRFSLSGAIEQGSLVFGAAPPGSLAALDGRPLHITRDGRFTFGFGYDQVKASLVSVRYPDGQGDSRSFTPAVRHYDVQRVDGLPQNTVTPPPEVMARIKREAEIIYLARMNDTEGRDFLAGFDWPAPGVLSGVFGSQRINNGIAMSPHFGVDMAAPSGTPIRAPADGVITVCGDHYLNGGFTQIDHGQGVSTCYLHQSQRMVKVGDVARRGQVIGLIGQTGRATGPHLHWAMNWFQLRLDPSRSVRTPKPEPL